MPRRFGLNRRRTTDAAKGFALCCYDWTDETAAAALLKERKATPRCIPLAGDDEPGKRLFTGKPAPRRVLFGKAY